MQSLQKGKIKYIARNKKNKTKAMFIKEQTKLLTFGDAFEKKFLRRTKSCSDLTIFLNDTFWLTFYLLYSLIDCFTVYKKRISVVYCHILFGFFDQLSKKMEHADLFQNIVTNELISANFSDKLDMKDVIN